MPTPDHDIGYNLPRDHIVSTRELKLPSSSRNHNQITSKSDSDHRRIPQNAPQASDTSSAGSPPGRKVVPSGYDYATEISELSLSSAGRSKFNFMPDYSFLV